MTILFLADFYLFIYYCTFAVQKLSNKKSYVCLNKYSISTIELCLCIKKRVDNYDNFDIP